MEKTVIYQRVSTSKQTTTNQRLALEKTAAARGWEIEKIYEDVITGSSGRADRPGLEAMMQAATRKEFHRVLVWSADRMGRSLAHVAGNMAELDALGIVQFYHLQGLDTSTPYGRAMVQMAAVFADLEKTIIHERIHAGLDRARAEGKRLGREPLSEEKINEVRSLRAANPSWSIREICAEARLSIGSVHKILKDKASAAL